MIHKKLRHISVNFYLPQAILIVTLFHSTEKVERGNAPHAVSRIYGTKVGFSRALILVPYTETFG